MTDVYCFAFVEDAPSAAVAKKLVATRNAQMDHRIIFHNGFPTITKGYGAIKSKCEAFLNMAKSGNHTFILTDLDTAECACTLIRRKGKTKIHREMLPTDAAHIGPRYNEVLCKFVESSWMPERAAEKSHSLERALRALMKVGIQLPA